MTSTLVKLLPTTTVQASALTLTGGVSGPAILADSLDTTYLAGNNDGDYFWMDMGTTTISSTQRVRNCQIFIRNARNLTGAATQDMQARLLDRSNYAFVPVGTFTTQRASWTVLNVSGPKATQSPAKREWTKADLDNMVLALHWYINKGTTAFQIVYGAWVNVEIVNAPTVSGAPVVTNYTDNATPTCSWTWADPDLEGNQIAYQVKMFSAAQIADPSFNATTSTASWDSGQVRSGSQNAVSTDPLKNAATYTAYVRVAKNAPNSSSVYWWSAWATSATFNVTFTSPYAPVIQTSSVISESNSYRAVLDILVPVNLLTLDSSSFETALGQWTALANCVIVRDTSQHAAGIASMKMTSTASGDMTAVCALNLLGNPRVDVGSQWTAVASFKTASSVRSCAVGVQWIALNGTTILATNYGSTSSDSSSIWTQVSYTGTAPAGSVYAKPVVKVVSTGAGSEIHYVDKVDLHAGSTVGWTPGGYQNNQSGLLLERGEAIDDARGPAVNWLSLQSASGGTVYRNTGVGFTWDATNSELLWQWLDQQISEAGDTPAGMVRWNPLTASASVIGIGFDFYGKPNCAPPVVPGQSHTFSVWAWTDLTTFTVTPQIRWLDASGAPISTSSASNATLTTAPQKLSVTATAPGNAALAYGALLNASSVNTKHVYITRAGFGLGSLPVDAKRGVGMESISWKPVRFLGVDNSLEYGTYPAGFQTGNVETLPDYEYPSGRPCLYRASIMYATGTQLVVSPYSNIVTVYAAPPPVTLLRSVTDPVLQVAVNRRKEAAYTFTDDAQIFHPLGADAAPIRVRDWAGGEDGTLDVITTSEAQATRLRSLIRSNNVLQIQWGQGGRSYIVITGVSIAETMSMDSKYCDADGRQDWLRYNLVSISYAETAAP